MFVITVVTFTQVKMVCRGSVVIFPVDAQSVAIEPVHGKKLRDLTIYIGKGANVIIYYIYK